MFIEVKTRKSDIFCRPEQSIAPRKEELYKNAAESFLEQYDYTNEIRFDVISIIMNIKHTEIEHFINAF